MAHAPEARLVARQSGASRPAGRQAGGQAGRQAGSHNDTPIMVMMMMMMKVMMTLMIAMTAITRPQARQPARCTGGDADPERPIRALSHGHMRTEEQMEKERWMYME